MSSANTDSFTSSFPIWIPYISFCSWLPWLGLPKLYWINSDKSEHPCLLSDLKENAFIFFTIENNVCCWFVIYGLCSVEVCVLVTQSCPTLCDPMDCSLPGSSVHGILQAGRLEWVAIPFSRGSSWHRSQTQVSRIAGRLLTVLSHQGSPHVEVSFLYAHFLESFYHKGIFNFVKCFFCIYWDYCHMVFILQFVNMVYHTNWLVCIEECFHPWDQSHLIIVCDPFNVLFDCLLIIFWGFLWLCSSVILALILFSYAILSDFSIRVTVALSLGVFLPLQFFGRVWEG